MVDSNKIVIYIVDDDEDDQVLTREAITSVIPNADIISFLNGKQCVEHILKNKSINIVPDLILLDINMPLMNGIQTLQAIRENDLLHLIQVVMFSTTSYEGQRNEAISLGAQAFYTKPTSFNELITIIEKIKETYFK